LQAAEAKEPPPPPDKPPAPKPKTRAILEAMEITEADSEVLDELHYGQWDTGPEWEVDNQVIFQTGEGALADIGLGPGRITLFGGPPKVGKTSLTMQFAVDAARLSGVVVFVGNGEMTPATLMTRQVARLSGVPIAQLGNLPHDLAQRVRAVRMELSSPPEEQESGLLGRIIFCGPPYDVHNLALHLHNGEFCEGIRPERLLLLVDYLQLFAAVDRTELRAWRSDRRLLPLPVVRDVGLVMRELRRIAKTGVSVVVVSAMTRDSYDNGQISGFRGSSEIEYACDDAFILENDRDRKEGIVHLRHVASRNNERRDRVLRFEGNIARFTPLEQ
jgi:hypothetical protein